MTSKGDLNLSPSIIKHAKAAFESQHPTEGFDVFLKKLSDSKSSAPLPLETDTSHPIAQYYISSSHNTYLTGNQLWSKSSTDAYREVLKRGCRCIEIDVWDGESAEDGEHDETEDSEVKKLKEKFKQRLGKLRSGSKSHIDTADAGEPAEHEGPNEPTRVEPRVLHGHTATREVSFRAVCEVVAKYAFWNSDMPLVVSFEVHCSPPQQKTMVEIIREYWANYLVPIPDNFSDSTPLPRLEQLKKKILVKVKYAPPAKNISNPLSKDPSQASVDEELREDNDPPQEGAKKGKIIEALSNLGIFTRACHFHSLDQSEAQIPTHVFAVSESKLLTLCEEQPDKLFEHNLRYLMRAFPKGTRVRSTNLNPAPLWRFGLQMVALNWQQLDAAMMLNHGMFDGSAGWVLKPIGYRPVEGQSQPIAKRVDLHVSIKLLAAQGLGRESHTPNVYIKTELHVESELEHKESQIPDGAKSRGGELKRRSATKHSSEPDFGGEVVAFDVKNVVPELSFLRLKAMDDVPYQKDPVIGWTCVRLDRLPRGLLLLPLRDVDAEVGDVRLLVFVEVQTSLAGAT